MNIICLGINHRTAPASLRERLSYNESKLKAMLARSSHGEREAVTPFSELGVLSTCNRVELYAVASQSDAHELLRLLTETSGVDDKDLEGHTYNYRDSEAAHHLFRVASGLDSLVLGEPQILGQVSEAHTLALRVGASGLILSRLFQAAIHAGKRARSETAISVKPATVSSVAVHLIASQVRQLEHSQVLVIGAEEMAESAKEMLRNQIQQFIKIEKVAGWGLVDDVIDPRTTRYHIYRGLKMSWNKTVSRPWRKHGVLPV